MDTNRNAGFQSHYLTNPIIRKLSRVNERADDNNAASYGGIFAKTLFFILMTVAGIAGFLVMRKIYPYTDISDMPTPILLASGAALLITVITPFLAWIIRPTIPVIGTLYCAAQGFSLSLLCNIAESEGKDYRYLAWLALVITLSIVMVMLCLYTKRIIKIDHKFKSVLLVLIFTSILASIAVAVMKFIPATEGIANYVTGNSIISIGASVVFIIIAALFLLSDFDAIEKTVENRLPKKYEWAAAFGLVFTIIWLYLKVLSLLSKVSNRK